MTKPKIVLQAGHVNCAKNSIVALRSSTGAANEQSFNKDIVERLKPILEGLGCEVTITDANANDDKNITGKDWDLFLAIHFDGDTYKDSGGFVDFPEPSTDGATKESQRIAKCLSDEYFSFTGIKNVPKRSNANTRYYYMWKYLSIKTPCVLIECGVGNRKPDDYNMLFLNRDKVLQGIVNGIKKAFSLTDNVEKYKVQIEELKVKLAATEKSAKSYQTKYESASKELELSQKKIKAQKLILDQIKASIGTYVD
jgi:N-acetylmuramoyl-L-alanine amidase